jgi:hypothetical protein
LEDVFGDMKGVTGAEDMAGVEDMMAGVKGTTGAEKGAEATKNGVRNYAFLAAILKVAGDHPPATFSRPTSGCIS